MYKNIRICVEKHVYNTYTGNIHRKSSHNLYYRTYLKKYIILKKEKPMIYEVINNKKIKEQEEIFRERYCQMLLNKEYLMDQMQHVIGIYGIKKVSKWEQDLKESMNGKTIY